MNIDPGTSVRAAEAAFEDEPEVRYAEPNFIRELHATPNDIEYSQLWGLNNTGQSVNGTTGTADADIDAPEAWDLSTGSSSVTVAVVDTGIAYDHPDLAPNIWTNPGETGGGKETNGLDDDSNGRVDDWRGWDFFANDNDPIDENRHGTHVAGTIGGRGNNSIGVAGASWQVKLMPLKLLNPLGGGLTSANMIAAFDYASDNGAKVVNGSFGSAAFSMAESDEIAGDTGTLFVFSAGNGGTDGVGDSNDITPQYPCNYVPANVVCVAATDQDDALAGFSNYGVTSVDLAAPGTNTLSSYPREVLFSDDFETALGSRWTTGGTNNLWERTGTALSGAFSLADSPSGNYANSTNSFARITGTFDLTGKIGCSAEFALAYSIAPPDFVSFDRSTNEFSGFTGSGFAGSAAAHFETFDLSALNGSATAALRFRMSSNGSGTGAAIDVPFRCAYAS